jgi:hypothetical protein
MGINMVKSKELKFGVTVTIAILLTLAIPVKAATQTGLASSLITEWHSSVDRSKCPDFRYPSYAPSLVKGEKVYKANCSSCHGDTPNASDSLVKSLRSTSLEKQFEFVCGGDPKGP